MAKGKFHLKQILCLKKKPSSTHLISLMKELLQFVEHSRYNTLKVIKNNIRDVDSIADLVLVLLVHLVHRYMVHFSCFSLISVRGYSISISLVWFSSYLSSQKLSVDGAVHRTLLSTALYLLIEFSCVFRQFLVSI